VRRRRSVAVVGLGLIGGSLARALSRAGWRVVGVDRADVLRRARAARAIAAGTPRLEAAAALADVVVLAAPPEANLRLLRRLAAVDHAALAITDVASVKGPICREAARLRLAGFVGGHPMAGSTASGFTSSSADLFRGRPWILTPQRAAPQALALVRAMVRSVGARAAILDARAHDRTVAFLSHVPQLVAWALQEAAGEDAVAARHLRLAGPGFHDMTRLAKSPRRLWREILAQNGPEVARALAALRRRLRG